MCVGGTLVSPAASRQLSSLHLVSVLPCAWVARRRFWRGGRAGNAPRPRAIGNGCEPGWSGWQAGCSALLLLLLLPRPEGWFIFRLKSRAFFNSLLKLALGTGAGCASQQGLGTSLGTAAAEERQSRDLAASVTPETAVAFLVPLLLPFPAGGCTFY